MTEVKGDYSGLSYFFILLLILACMLFCCVAIWFFEPTAFPACLRHLLIWFSVKYD